MTRRPSRYGRRRAAILAGVYVLMIAHFVHWKIAGETLAPLELNEVMHTLELGLVTAGFLFMCVALLSVLVFGRFFCSWGCHILALEDLCAWLLAKIRIRPRPVRSRLLLLVPPLAMMYMFAWPQVKRLAVTAWPSLRTTLGDVPTFAWRLHSDEQGWASFVTSDYARNLPGPGIAIITFLVCGFAMVWMLGSRSFCTYGCPYGALFGLADRCAPGRIVLSGDCTGCGQCTAACDSDIDVHDEVRRFGKVVHPGCLKDLDCVSACPTSGLRFGFTRPAMFKSWSSDGRRPRPGMPWREDLLAGAVFVLTLVVFRGLYESVPFLMTLGLGSILALAAVIGLRLLTRPHVRVQGLLLKSQGALRRAGRYSAFGLVMLGLFVGHSAAVRFHEVRSIHRYEAVCASVSAGTVHPMDAEVTRALEDHRFLDRWGLWSPEGYSRRHAELAMFRGTWKEAATALRRVIEHAPEDAPARLRLAHALIARGEASEAERVLHAALDKAPGHHDPESIRLAAWTGLGELYGDTGRYGESAGCFRKALDLDPECARLHYNLGIVLGASGHVEKGVASLGQAERLTPNDPDVHHHLARLLTASGRPDEAEVHRRMSARLRDRRQRRPSRALPAHPANRGS